MENGVNICTSIKCFKIMKRNIPVNNFIHDKYMLPATTPEIK